LTANLTLANVLNNMAQNRRPTTRTTTRIAKWLRTSRLGFIDPGDEALPIGLTQVELAQRAGVCVTTISEIERGLKRPSQLTLVRLATALGLDVQEIGALSRQNHRKGTQ
jgi:DNA-binding XRE family transcriptional regulator